MKNYYTHFYSLVILFCVSFWGQLALAQNQPLPPHRPIHFIEQGGPHHPPVQPNNQGPWNADLSIQTSPDGTNFSAGSTLVEAAGVPSAITTSDGTIYVAFQWFPTDPVRKKYFDKVAVIASKDSGKSWSDPTPIEIADFPESYQRPFDPTLTITESGKIRIYFSSSPDNNKRHASGIATHSAISDDGVHFNFEPGVRFGQDDNKIIDPAVILFNNVWHLTSPIGKSEDGAYHAVSKDGINFTKKDNIASQGFNWTGNLILVESGMRFYGGSRQGVWWSFSSDGSVWSKPQITNVRGGDPAITKTQDGKFILISISPSQQKRNPPENMR